MEAKKTVIITKLKSRGPQRVGLTKMYPSKQIPLSKEDPDSHDKESTDERLSTAEANDPTEESKDLDNANDVADESNNVDVVDIKNEDFHLSFSSDSNDVDASLENDASDDKEVAAELLSDDSEDFTGFHVDFLPQIKPLISDNDIYKFIVKIEKELLVEELSVSSIAANYINELAADQTIKKEILENSDKENSFQENTASNQDSKDDSTTNDDGLETSSSNTPTGKRVSALSSRLSGTESPSMAGGRRSAKRTSTTDLSNPAFRKPFEFGWKRELVYRNSTDPSSKVQADVYYYTPKNKKIRSNREVTDHLHGTELTTENFTFFKDTLNLNDPSKEIIRSAAQRSSIGGEFVPPVKKIPTKKVKELKAIKVKESPPRRMTLLPFPKAGSKSAMSSSPGKRVFPRIKGAKSIKLGSLAAKAKKAAEKEGDLEMGTLPPGWNVPSNKAKLEPCSIRCLGVMGIVPSLQCRLCLCLYHPECVGLGPMSSAIHSYVCKNCQQDLRDGKSSKGPGSSSSSSSTKTSPPPLTPISSLANAKPKGVKLPAGSPMPPPPKLQRFPGLPEPGKLTTVPKFVKVTSAQGTGTSSSNTISMKTLSGSGGKTFRTKGQPMVGGVTTWLPPSSTIQLNTSNNSSGLFSSTSTTVASDGDSPPAVQSIMKVAGKKYIVVQKSNVVSISNPSSPAATPAGKALWDGPEGSSTATSQPPVVGGEGGKSLVKAVGAGGPILPKPATFFMGSGTGAQNPPGVLLVPCFNQNPSQVSYQKDSQGQPQKYFFINGSPGNFVFGGLQSKFLKDGAASWGDEKTTSSTKRKAGEEEGEGDTLSSAKRAKTDDEEDYEGSEFMKNFASNLSKGYSVFLQVFQYLKTQELLRAARVCKMWRDLASHRSLWRTVRLKNSHVDDWQGLALALCRHETQHLDLRKMLLPSDPAENEKMWRDFSKYVCKARTLTRIDLCRCPPFAVEDIALHCPQLVGLNAVTIKCSMLNLMSFGNLTNLVELRLKSMTGAHLERDLNPIKELIHLRHLALTTFKDIGQAGCDNFKYLTNLESFELGECVDLPENFGQDVLMRMTKLQRLRLEKGQGKTCFTFKLLDSIKDLPLLSQLELINYDVKIGFDLALAQCTNVRRLLLIPTYVTQSATTNYVVFEGVTKLNATLSHFVWGVTQELLRVTELFVDQCDSNASKPPVRSKDTKKDAPSKKLYESIPILKPGSLDRTENLENLSREELKDGKTNAGQVEIQTLHKLQKQLVAALPNTKIKIVKIPFHATWKQTIAEPPHH